MTAKTKGRVRLNNDCVAKFPVPAKGGVTLWDNDPKAVGFGIRIYSTGTRSFVLNFWFDGAE